MDKWAGIANTEAGRHTFSSPSLSSANPVRRIQRGRGWLRSHMEDELESIPTNIGSIHVPVTELEKVQPLQKKGREREGKKAIIFCFSPGTQVKPLCNCQSWNIHPIIELAATHSFVWQRYSPNCISLLGKAPLGGRETTVCHSLTSLPQISDLVWRKRAVMSNISLLSTRKRNKEKRPRLWYHPKQHSPRLHLWNQWTGPQCSFSCEGVSHWTSCSYAMKGGNSLLGLTTKVQMAW